MSVMKFTPFERELLKLAGSEAQRVGKAAKAACKRAFLTEGESEAHNMIGYAEEAQHFLDKPDGKNKNEVQLSFGHRTALRTGCLIMIETVQHIAEDQVEALVDDDGVSSTKKREKDFRRLEGRLRSLDEEQKDLGLSEDNPDAPEGGDDANAATPAAKTDDDHDGPLVGEGPFEGEGVTERLALPAPAVDLTQEEIEEADYEIIDESESAPGKKRTAKAKKKAAKSSGKKSKASTSAKGGSAIVGNIARTEDVPVLDDDEENDDDDSSPNPYAPPQLDDSAAIDEDDEAAHTPEDE